MKPALLILFVVITIVSLSCKHTTEPEPQPGRRDYVWTVDTINPGQEFLLLTRIWGSSKNDVWAVGASSSTSTAIWHYNGSRWSCDSVFRFVDPTAIFGFDNNNVWLGNLNSTIWKLFNNNWVQYGKYNPEGYDLTAINCFDGTSTSNIYGAGFSLQLNTNKYKGIIIRHNGNSWYFINIPDTRVGFETMAIEQKTGVLILSGTEYHQGEFLAKIYSWDGNKLTELMSDGGSSFVTKLGDKIFVTLNSIIYKYENKKLVLWKNNKESLIFGNIICGRSQNDFFIGAIGGIAHYNGTNYEIVYKTNPNETIQILRGAIFEKDVFLIANNYTLGKNLIIHGEIK